MAEHGHGHGHESSEKHGSKHDEWLTPRMKQTLKASGITMGLSAMLLSAACLPILPGYIIGQGLLGAGIFNMGWKATKSPEKRGGHGGGHGGHH